MRICRCCVRIRARISVRVRIRVRDGVRISNRVRRRVKLANYSLITALHIATSADPHISLSAFYPWPIFRKLHLFKISHSTKFNTLDTTLSLPRGPSVTLSND